MVQNEYVVLVSICHLSAVLNRETLSNPMVIFFYVPAERAVFSLYSSLQRKDQLGSAQDPQIHSTGSKKRSRVWVCLKMMYIMYIVKKPAVYRYIIIVLISVIILGVALCYAHFWANPDVDHAEQLHLQAFHCS